MSALAYPDPGDAADPLEGDGPRDPFGVEQALGAPEPLATLNRESQLVAADVHVARRLAELAGTSDPEVILAVALAVAAARAGHAFVQLDEVGRTAWPMDQQDPHPVVITSGTPPYPEFNGWITRLRGVPRLIATDAGARAPLRLQGPRLYLDRYWREERRLADALLARNRMRADVGDLARLGDRIARVVTGEDSSDQRLAVAVAMLRELTVLAGGPGTGKTTTVAWIVELTLELARANERPEPLIALCAPTGKAAARLQEAVAGAAPAATIHRLLGWLPGGRFRHDARNRLPHDLVIVDETSMVPLSMMVRLAEAVRDDAQLVLVGDPDQLAAIEVGAVLRDIVGPAAVAPRFGQAMRVALQRVTGEPVQGVQEARTFGDAVSVLRRGHRSGPAISALAEAIRRGDGDGVVAELRRGSTGPGSADGRPPGVDPQPRLLDPQPGLLDPQPSLLDPQPTLFDPQPTLFDPQPTLFELEPAGPVPTGSPPAVVWLPASDGALDQLQAEAVGALAPMVKAARAGDGALALSLLKGFRLLCAHRHGPYGMAHWGATVEGWLRQAIPGFETGSERYPGLPLLVTRNDYELRLHNGDTGVVVAGAGAQGGPVAVFDTSAGPVELAPSRLADVEPLYAATVYRSQGSEFEVAAIVLPEPDSPLLSRELIYTAITRARARLYVIGSEESVRAAVARPAGRASGLGELLWSVTELE